jgi:hypothetical protein
VAISASQFTDADRVALAVCGVVAETVSFISEMDCELVTISRVPNEGRDGVAPVPLKKAPTTNALAWFNVGVALEVAAVLVAEFLLETSTVADATPVHPLAITSLMELVLL